MLRTIPSGMLATLPHWERGKRVYGYWAGLIRLGWVGLPMERPVSSYYWEVEEGPNKGAKGMVKTLAQAKKDGSQVENKP